MCNVKTLVSFWSWSAGLSLNWSQTPKTDFLVTRLIYERIFEPAHEIMVLIAYLNSEGPGETAHPRSLARAFAVRTQSMEVDKGSDKKSDM